MGWRGWYRKITGLKTRKNGPSNRLKSVSSEANGGSSKNNELTEEIAATRIQRAFRAYKGRKAIRRLRGTVKLQGAIEAYSVNDQVAATLKHIHSWSRVQSEIKARRLCMVTEGRLKQKKIQNQIKLEAKLHELEVEWSSGSETMEEILQKIQQREEAAVKRERAMAYAFSHQWRANSGHYFGQAYYDLGKESWGWSWMERWIAIRPWEIRVQADPKKVGKTASLGPVKLVVSVNNPPLSNGKISTPARKPSDNNNPEIQTPQESV
nr:protein IQ-DOMAIN 1-like isoform X1 [Ipomoea batatas]